MTEEQFEGLAQHTAERFLRDTQSLIDQHGPEEGQLIARTALTSLAEMALNGASLSLPSSVRMSDMDMRAIAYAAMLAVVTMRAETVRRN
ncbi:hypothetical protein [Microvirga calopogonii]|uniref:hypothetical protein n=1 Tax=Microvirga calopogonii TaxID=2078013 RepID=UPI000E0DF4DC|nr:hypothetical protein [Microvirga calopogonii]